MIGLWDMVLYGNVVHKIKSRIWEKAMKNAESRKFTLSLIETTPAVFLATVDERGLPQIRALTNLRHKRRFPSLRAFFKQLENPFVTYTTTFASSAKAKQIRHNARVALYYCRPERFFGVMLSGSMETVRDRAIKETLWQQEWLAFWSKGPTDSRYRVYRFVPDGAKGWSGEEVFRFAIQGSP